MNYGYNPNKLITVLDIVKNKEISVYDNLDKFCNAYGFNEVSARHYISTNATFVSNLDNRYYVAYQDHYDTEKAYYQAFKEIECLYGDYDYNINARIPIYRVCVNPYPEDNLQQYTLHSRYIYLTKEYLGITNNRGLDSHYPYQGLVFSHKGYKQELEIYFKGKCLGLYTSDKASDKHLVEKVKAHTVSVIASPVLEDCKPIKFESIAQAAKYFEVFPVTIRNRIQTCKPIDKDNVFYSLKFLGE